MPDYEAGFPDLMGPAYIAFGPMDPSPANSASTAATKSPSPPDRGRLLQQPARFQQEKRVRELRDRRATHLSGSDPQAAAEGFGHVGLAGEADRIGDLGEIGRSVREQRPRLVKLVFN